jgi:hypothetical protein
MPSDSENGGSLGNMELMQWEWERKVKWKSVDVSGYSLQLCGDYKQTTDTQTNEIRISGWGGVLEWGKAVKLSRWFYCAPTDASWLVSAGIFYKNAEFCSVASSFLGPTAGILDFLFWKDINRDLYL